MNAIPFLLVFFVVAFEFMELWHLREISFALTAVFCFPLWWSMVFGALILLLRSVRSLPELRQLFAIHDFMAFERICCVDSCAWYIFVFLSGGQWFWRSYLVTEERSLTALRMQLARWELSR
jgi:hypothetical protein